MSGGEGVGGRRRLATRHDAARKAAFPALVLALAIFCVEGLQVLSSVVREDLASPPLVEVPPIDLGASPPPLPRPTAVAGAVVDAGPAVDPPDPAAVGTPIETRSAVPDPGAAVAANLSPPPPDVMVSSSLSDAGQEPVVAAAKSAMTPMVPTAGSGGVVAASTGSDDRARDRASPARRRAPGRSRLVPHGPPPGRPVGPDCDAKPGRRAACDRRPPID